MPELRPSDPAEPGITRRRRGRSFSYEYACGGRPVKDRRTLNRIKKLVLPPAWRDVWICRDPDGHIQATGTDAAGRRASTATTTPGARSRIGPSSTGSASWPSASPSSARGPGRPRREGPDPRPGAGRRRPHARHRPVPRRRRGVRVLRPRDPAHGARHLRQGPGELRLPRQGRQAARGGDHRPRRLQGRHRPPHRPPTTANSCATRPTASGSACAATTSTPTCGDEGFESDVSAKDFRTWRATVLRRRGSGRLQPGPQPHRPPAGGHQG